MPKTGGVFTGNVQINDGTIAGYLGVLASGKLYCGTTTDTPVTQLVNNAPVGTWNDGLTMQGATGGDPGAGKINAADFEINGSSIVDQLAAKMDADADIPASQITYLGGSTGAVARAVNSRFDEMPYITDLGASSAQTDNAQEIQDLIDYIYANKNGGVIFIPPGGYKTSTLTLKGGVRLVGSGRKAGSLRTTVASPDATVVSIGSTCEWAGLSNLTIIGSTETTAATNLVIVEDNVKACIEHCDIIGGLWGLYVQGNDGTYHDLRVEGYGTAGGCIVSNGANWYERCKLDHNTSTVSAAFKQGSYILGSGVAENTFSLCDFSGNFNHSVLVDDGGAASAVSTFLGCVISSPVYFKNHKLAKFAGTHFGDKDVTFDNGVVVMGGCAAFSSISVTGSSANKAIAGCHNIT